MKLLLCVALLLFVSGCSAQASTAETDGGKGKSTANGNEGASAEGASQEGTEIGLSPENTKIQFVGKHTDKEKPDPRTGTFEKFTGKAIVNAGAPTSIQVDIETASLSTEIEKLTTHLKSPDFFDVREHPQAKFQSTKIEADGDGKVKVTGNLTLLGTTKSITFPATVSTKDGFSLKAEFKIDRTQFGMDYGLEGVEKDVEMTITVGQK